MILSRHDSVFLGSRCALLFLMPNAECSIFNAQCRDRWAERGFSTDIPLNTAPPGRNFPHANAHPMKRIFSSSGSAEVGLLRSRLEAAGIRCALRNEALSQMLP